MDMKWIHIMMLINNGNICVDVYVLVLDNYIHSFIHSFIYLFVD